MAGKTANDTQGVAILLKTLQILDYISGSTDPVGISQISRETKIPKANVFRIIKTLESTNIIFETGDGYLLGSKLIEYGNRAKLSNNALQLALPVMNRLTEEIGEAVGLGVPFENDLLVLHTTSVENSRLVSNLPPISSIINSSVGKLLLAHKSDEEIIAFISEHKARTETVNTIRTAEQFFKERPEILAKNISYDREENEYGLTCIGSGIFDKNGLIIAGISISGPTTRLQFKGYKTLEEKVKAAAEEITNILASCEASFIG